MTSKRTALHRAAASVASATALLIGHAPASAGTQAPQIDVNETSRPPPTA